MRLRIDTFSMQVVASFLSAPRRDQAMPLDSQAHLYAAEAVKMLDDLAGWPDPTFDKRSWPTDAGAAMLEYLRAHGAVSFEAPDDAYPFFEGLSRSDECLAAYAAEIRTALSATAPNADFASILVGYLQRERGLWSRDKTFSTTRYSTRGIGLTVEEYDRLFRIGLERSAGGALDAVVPQFWGDLGDAACTRALCSGTTREEVADVLNRLFATHYSIALAKTRSAGEIGRRFRTGGTRTVRGGTDRVCIAKFADGSPVVVHNPSADEVPELGWVLLRSCNSRVDLAERITALTRDESATNAPDAERCLLRVARQRREAEDLLLGVREYGEDEQRKVTEVTHGLIAEAEAALNHRFPRSRLHNVVSWSTGTVAAVAHHRLGASLWEAVGTGSTVSGLMHGFLKWMKVGSSETTAGHGSAYGAAPRFGMWDGPVKKIMQLWTTPAPKWADTPPSA